MITKRFIKASAIYTIAGALPMANAVLLLPFYLYYLPAQEYGVLALYLSFSILIQIVVTFSFDVSLILYFHEFKKDPAKLSLLVSSSFTFMLLLGAAVSLVLLIFGGLIFEYFYSGRDLLFYPYGFFAVITGVFQSIFKVNNSFLQGRERPVLFLRSNLLSFFLVATLTIVGLKFFPATLIGPVGGRMVAFVVSGGWVLFRIYREFGLHFDFRLLRTTLSYNIYQFIYQIQMWVINYFDRFLMAMLILMSDLGVYDFTIKCLLLLDFVIAGMFTAFFPKILSRAAEQGMKGTSVEINRYYHGLTGMIMVMVSGTILVLPWLITEVVPLFASKGVYVKAADFVPYASLVFLLRAMRYYFGMPYSTMKYSRPLPVIFLFVSGIKVCLSYALIREFGIFGAIAATLVAVGGEIFVLWFWIRTRFHFFFNPFKMILGPLLLMAIVLVVEPAVPSIYRWVAHVGYALFTGVMLVLLYRNEIKLIKIQNFFRES